IAIARTGPISPLLQDQDQGAVRESIANGPAIEFANLFNAQGAGASLIGQGAVDKPVANHPAPSGQRRFDGPRVMISARRGEEQRLGLWAPPILGTAQQQVADLLGAVAAAGLAGHQHVQSTLLQRLRKSANLRRLADPFPTL